MGGSAFFEIEAKTNTSMYNGSKICDTILLLHIKHIIIIIFSYDMVCLWKMYCIIEIIRNYEPFVRFIFISYYFSSFGFSIYIFKHERNRNYIESLRFICCTPCETKGQIVWFFPNVNLYWFITYSINREFYFEWCCIVSVLMDMNVLLCDTICLSCFNQVNEIVKT